MSIAGVIAVDVSRSDATICLFCIRKRFRALSQFERRSIFVVSNSFGWRCKVCRSKNLIESVVEDVFGSTIIFF